MTEGPQSIPLSDIWPNPSPVREPKLTQSFVEDIRERGIVQPITVRPSPGGRGFLVVAGMRRYLAAKKLAMKEVPCSVMTLDEREAFFVAVAENLQREQMGPYDVAHAVLRATEEMRLAPADVATELHREVKEITSWIAIARNPKLMDHLKKADSTLGLALALERAWSEVDNLQEQGAIESDQAARLLRDFLTESRKLSLHDFERLARKSLDPLVPGRIRQTALAETDAEASPHQQAVDRLVAKYSGPGAKVEHSVPRPDAIIRFTTPEAQRKLGCEGLWIEVDDTHATSTEKIRQVRSMLGPKWRLLVYDIRSGSEQFFPDVEVSKEKRQKTLGD